MKKLSEFKQKEEKEKYNLKKQKKSLEFKHKKK
jgi:hypothetical protein